MRACVRACVQACLCVCVYVECICIFYVCVCMHTYIHTNIRIHTDVRTLNIQPYLCVCTFVGRKRQDSIAIFERIPVRVYTCSHVHKRSRALSHAFAQTLTYTHDMCVHKYIGGSEKARCACCFPAVQDIRSHWCSGVLACVCAPACAIVRVCMFLCDEMEILVDDFQFTIAHVRGRRQTDGQRPPPPLSPPPPLTHMRAHTHHRHRGLSSACGGILTRQTAAKVRGRIDRERLSIYAPRTSRKEGYKARAGRAFRINKEQGYNREWETQTCNCLL